jgi:hypothetical protein
MGVQDLLAEMTPMPTKMLQDVKGILEKFDLRKEAFWEVAISDALRPIGQATTLSQTDRDVWWAESSGFSFARPHDRKRSVWGTDYGPQFVGTQNDSAPYYSPDIAQADVGIVTHWKDRAIKAQHPILKARYADLVWDFAKLVTGEKPDVDFARIAIDAYLQAMKLAYEYAIQPIQYSERALDLSISSAVVWPNKDPGHPCFITE